MYCRSRNVSGQRKRNFPAVTRTAARRSLPESAEIAALEAEIQASGDKRTQMELVIQNKQREKEEKAGRQKTFFVKRKS